MQVCVQRRNRFSTYWRGFQELADNHQRTRLRSSTPPITRGAQCTFFLNVLWRKKLQFAQGVEPIARLRVHAAVTVPRPGFLRSDFVRITMSTSKSIAVRNVISRSTENPSN